MRAKLAIVALVIASVASAAPRRGRSKGKPKPKPAPAAPAPAPEPTPAPAPAPEPTPPPPTPPASEPSAAPGADGPPGASAATPPPPPMAPRMAMRKPQAHGGFVADLDCSACHTADGWGLAQSAGASGFDHDRTGFPLRGSHVQTSCGSCHTGTAKPANNCEGCHRDPHQGQQVGTCAECHTATAWSDTRTLEQHRRTRMPLTGRHATIDCSDCHKRQGERAYSQTPTDCFACHAKDYHNASVHPTHDGSTGQPAFPRNCAQCHQTTAWSPAFADPTTLPGNTPRLATGEHDRYFVLTTGSHRTADCASCHADTRRMQLVRCDGCHSSVTLRSQHAQPVAPAAVACLHCHPRGASR
ncbi:MAG: hypothetical protein ACM31C_19960 [Acidobacteriota bacterium]